MALLAPKQLQVAIYDFQKKICKKVLERPGGLVMTLFSMLTKIDIILCAEIIDID